MLLQLVPSGDTALSDQTHSVLQRQRNPLPRDPRSPEKVAGKKKSLVYWAIEASAGIRFPISAVSFQQIPGAGGERVDPPGREWGCGSRDSEFAERSPDCGRGRTRNQQQRGQECTDHRDHIKYCTGTKLRRLIRTGHHREPGRWEGSPRCKKLGRGVVRSTNTLANSRQRLWTQSTELGACAVAFPCDLGDSALREGSRTKEADAPCVLCPRVQAREERGRGSRDEDELCVLVCSSLQPYAANCGRDVSHGKARTKVTKVGCLLRGDAPRRPPCVRGCVRLLRDAA